MAAFAASTDMVNRYDVRTLGQLCGDGATIGEGALASDDKMTAALESATGQIIAAVLVGERYSRADLDGLSDESADYLVDLTCRVAFWKLWDRKPYTGREDPNRTAAKKEALEALDMLRKGLHVFDVDGVKEAGRPDVDRISVAEASNFHLIVDRARGSFYPSRRTSS